MQRYKIQDVERVEERLSQSGSLSVKDHLKPLYDQRMQWAIARLRGPATMFERLPKTGKGCLEERTGL